MPSPSVPVVTTQRKRPREQNPRTPVAPDFVASSSDDESVEHPLNAAAPLRVPYEALPPPGHALRLVTRGVGAAGSCTTADVALRVARRARAGDVERLDVRCRRATRTSSTRRSGVCGSSARSPRRSRRSAWTSRTLGA